MSTLAIDTKFFEPLSSPAAITAFILVLLTLLYASIQDTAFDPLKILFPPKFSTEITALQIYPVKSCRGIQVSSRKLLKTGLELDRNWMFIDAQAKKFITIREYRKMTLIDTALEDGMLHLSIRGTNTRISTPAPPTRDWLEKNCVLEPDIDIWDEKTDAWLYDSHMTAPISELLGIDVRFVYKGPTPRMNGGNGDPELYGEEQPHYFADMMSVLIGSESSLAELNSRLAAQGHDELTIERFRPNIIVKGGEPWSEDSWKRVRIHSPQTEARPDGTVSLNLDVPNRCLRCQVPNVNPETAVKHDSQPWMTLTKYRKIDPGKLGKGKPCFGMLCIPKQEGVLEVGMRLEVLETTKKHAFLIAKWKDL